MKFGKDKDKPKVKSEVAELKVLLFQDVGDINEEGVATLAGKMSSGDKMVEKIARVKEIVEAL